MDPLTEARQHLEQYQNRIDNDNYRGDLESRTRWEDASYKQSMMHAAIAQAEAADRLALALERLAEAQENAVFGYGQSAVDEAVSALSHPSGAAAGGAEQAMEEHRDNLRRAREQFDGLRRGMGLE